MQISEKKGKKQTKKYYFCIRIMNYNTITLPNGLRIIHLHAASPVVYCGYEINAGTRDEEAGEEGMAHFCEHITFKGTERRRALQILNCLESVGGDLNAFTNKESTVYYSAVLHDHFPRAVDLLTDIVFHSIYPQTEIDKEVAVICDEIESYNDSPAELIFDEFESIIFKNHPLGHNILGNAEQLRMYRTADARRFTSKFYRPENAVFFAYGDVDFKKLVYLLRRATMGFPERKPIFNRHQETVLPVYEPQNITVERHTHQAHVMMGNRAYSVDSDKRIALYLLNNILGGPGMNARLNLSLRERHGLVYTVESSMISYSDTGLWCVYFGCDQHDIKSCMRLVRHELDRLMEKPLTATQLNAAKKQIKGQIAIACDNRESFALDFGKSFLHYGWEKNIERLFANIDALTAKQLQEVALDIFAQNRMTTLIYQ